MSYEEAYGKCWKGSLWFTMTQNDSEWLRMTPSGLGFLPIRAWFVRNESPIDIMWFSTAWLSHVLVTHQDMPDSVESLRLGRQMTGFFKLRGRVWRSQLTGFVGAYGCAIPWISSERVAGWSLKLEVRNRVVESWVSTTLQHRDKID
jgi:hypothetical protein